MENVKFITLIRLRSKFNFNKNNYKTIFLYKIKLAIPLDNFGPSRQTSQ